MGHGKLRRFRENETFKCLLQPDTEEILVHGETGFSVRPHEVKGHWNETMFDKPGPIILELGCGRGEYTIDLALRNPQFNYIGVDIKGARLWKGAKFATENKLGNVAFLRTRIEFIEAFFDKDEVSEIWLTFSDPQLKSENSRLTSPVFLERYRRFLRPGGVIHLKTDSVFLHQYSKAVAESNGLRILACTDDLYGSEREGFYSGGIASVCGRDAVDAVFSVQTYYEKMFLAQGLKITYLCFTLDRIAPVGYDSESCEGDLIARNPESEGPAPADSDGGFVYPDFDADHWRAVEGRRRSFGHQPHPEPH